MSNSNKGNVIEKKIQLERKFPDDLQSYFVSDVVVQHTSEHFTLSFFEIWIPPIIADNEDERKEILETLEKLESKCVARLVTTPEKMRDFVRAMSENLERYDKMMKAFSKLERENKND